MIVTCDGRKMVVQLGDVAVPKFKTSAEKLKGKYNKRLRAEREDKNFKKEILDRDRHEKEQLKLKKSGEYCVAETYQKLSEKYEIGREISEGGFGTVHEVT